MRRTAFIHSREIENYRYPAGCPLKTERSVQVRDQVASLGLLAGDGRSEVAPRNASRGDLEKFHSAKYVDALQRGAAGELTPEGALMGLGTMDCPVFEDLYPCALYSAGASLTGAELILNGEASVAFNPSGGFHHAGAETASGFCYVNDVVLACLRLVEGGKRVLFLDVDAHHGDGVQNAFYGRRDVMTISFHESGQTLFPGTGFENEIGEGEGEGFSVNVPLPVGTYDGAYLCAFRDVALPLAGAFDPDAIVLELGMDGLSGDPLTHLSLTNNVHAEVVKAVLSLGRPIVATGGGGYHVENTVRGWALAWREFCGEGQADDMTLGLGGVMLESNEWAGGLRDRVLPVEEEQRREVDAELEATVSAVKRNVFGYHGLGV